MTSDSSPGALRLPILHSALLLLAVPAVVFGALLAARSFGWQAAPVGAAADRRAAQVVDWFSERLAGFAADVDRYLATGATTADEGTTSQTGSRLEGVGVLDADGNYLVWNGTPPEPGRELGTTPSWQVRAGGVHTRLLYHGGPDPDGRTVLASFLIDSKLPGQEFAALLPARLRSGVQISTRFLDSELPRTVADELPVSGFRELRAPDGTRIAEMQLTPVDPNHAARQARRSAAAWAGLIGLLAGIAVVDWRKVVGSFRGLLVVLALLLVVRVLVSKLRIAAVLLPSDLGTAALFGTPALGGWADSPASLLLSSGLAYLAARAIRRTGRENGRTRPVIAAGISALGAVLAMAATLWLAVALARDASLPLLDPLLDRAAPWRISLIIVRWSLAASLGLLVLASAELGALAIRFLGRREPESGAARVTVVVAALALALIAAFVQQRFADDVAVERLRSEFMPLVVDQRARREVALLATLDHVRQAFVEDRGAAVDRTEYLAYRFWSTSELFFRGYKSSLDFYNPQGELVSHFGFDLPLLVESRDLDTMAPFVDAAPEIRVESLEPVAAVQQRLLHAQLPILSAGRLLGHVVGHVLDEPDNLPFLPSSQPFLSALGPAAPHAEARSAFAAPQYVLYDAPGTVLLSTLRQPPAMPDVLVDSFESDGSIRIESGDELFHGVAVQDSFHRLHLLVVPVRTALERLAAATRLALLALLLLLLFDLSPRIVNPRRLAGIWGGLRGSFYRKLLAALLVASIVPLVGLALFVRGYVENRGRSALTDSAIQFAGAAQRVLNDYTATQRTLQGGGTPLNDEIVYWLRSVIGQEIHVYENGLLKATSKRELFASGLLPPRLDGEVQKVLGREGGPYLVLTARIGPTSMPVAYAPVESPDPLRGLVVAVPMVAQQALIARAVNRIAEMILLATVLLVGLLAVVAAYLARTVARPVRELVGATGRIAGGDYGTRLVARTGDEVADLVRGFNSMAASLSSQREDLERRRDYMERLLQHATTGVISVDARGTVVTLNPAARELLSTAESRPLIGSPLIEALDSSRDLQPLARLLATDPREPGAPEEVDLERNGEPHRLRLVRVDLPDPAGGTIGRLLLLDDVTQLMKSNQLAAWAEMARAIAHEIKNPLTPIQLSAEHLQRLLRDRSVLPAADIEACLETVKKQVRNLYQIAGEFSAYAKLPDLAPSPVDPVEFLRETVAPYRSAAPPGIEIVERYDPAGPVAVDAKVLGRAVVNLIENALQAMPDGGRLTIGVEPEAEDHVVLSVTDSGVGLDPEVRRRLFEPYFSTKSSGTGLGLAIVQRAVDAHQGTIEVDSAPGSGTTFRIRLPRTPAGS